MPDSDSTAPPVAEQKPNSHKRRLTEARREQNRRSQRVWREKQKQRRDEQIKAKTLEELSRSAAAAASTTTDQRPSSDSTGEPEAVFQPGSDDGSDSQHGPPNPLVHEDVLSAPSSGLLADLDAPYLDGQHFRPAEALPISVALYYHAPADPDAEDMRHIWPVPNEVDEQIYILPPTRGNMPDWTSTTESAHPQQVFSSASLLSSSSGGISSFASPLFTDSLSLRSRSSASPSRHSGARGPTQHFPSPYLNHLQLIGESGFAATITIALSLGISKSSYVNDHPSPFTTRSSTTVHTIPVDLRPTAHQLMLPHPCYLDCIPFPHFRSMAIYLSSVSKLDHASLFLDLMHDGLVCWGRAGANARHGRSMRDGVAWSRRSWEAKRWFWRRWSWIARMREEDIDDLAGLRAMCATADYDEEDDEDGMLSGSQWWWSLQDDGGFEEGFASQQRPQLVSGVTQAQEQSLSLMQSLPQGVPQSQLQLSAQSQSQPQLLMEEPGELNSRHKNYGVGVRQTHENDILAHWNGTVYRYGEAW